MVPKPNTATVISLVICFHRAILFMGFFGNGIILPGPDRTAETGVSRDGDYAVVGL